MSLAASAIGSPSEAVAALRRIVAADPFRPQAWRQLADHLDACGDREGAADAYSQHVRHAVRDPVLLSAATALHANLIPTAETRLRQQLRQAPTDVVAIRMLAEIALRLDRAEDAERLLLRCLELAPAFREARYNYAVALHRLNKPVEAIAELDTLLRDVPPDPAYRNLKAAVLCRTGDYEPAIAIYAALLGEQPSQPHVWLSYGHALKTAGHTDRAIDAYRRCVALDPDFGEAYWSLANLKTFRFDEAEIAHMRAALARDDLAGEHRLHIAFALGKALEDRKDYASSFAHYAHGNGLRLAQVPYSADDTSARLARVREQYTADFFRAREGMGADAPDPIFIVGLPRAGSTLIEQILASHPAVEGTMELPEIISITRALRASAGGACGRLSRRARAHGRRCAARARCAIPRAHAHPSQARPAVLHRQDAEQLHARRPDPARCCRTRRSSMRAGIRWRAACPASSSISRVVRTSATSLEDLGRYYRDYVGLMAHFDAVQPGRVHRVFYENMVEHTEREVRRLLDYCGLPFEEACLNFFDNDRPVRTASSEQVRQPIYTSGIDQWRRYEAWLDPLKAALGPALDDYEDSRTTA